MGSARPLGAVFRSQYSGFRRGGRRAGGAIIQNSVFRSQKGFDPHSEF